MARFTLTLEDDPKTGNLNVHVLANDWKNADTVETNTVTQNAAISILMHCKEMGMKIPDIIEIK